MTERERFNKLIRKLRTKKEVRVHMHMSLYDDAWLRIYEVNGGRLGKCIVDVSDEEEANLYRRASNDIRMILIWEEGKSEKKNGKVD